MDIKAITIALEHEINRSNTLNENINLIAQYAKKYTGAERCSIFIYKEDKDQLKSIYSDGIKGLTLHSNVGLVGYAFHKRESILENDTRSSRYFFKAVDEKSGYKTRVVLAVPIVNAQYKRVGVMQLFNKQEGFHELDKLLIESLTVFLLHLMDPPLSEIHGDDPSKHISSKNVSVTLQEKFDTYLRDKKLFLMEDGNAYYKILEMKRDYFIGADKCYQLDASPKEINIFYFTSSEEFLSVKMRVKIDRDTNGVLVQEFDFQKKFVHCGLEKDK